MTIKTWQERYTNCSLEEAMQSEIDELRAELEKIKRQAPVAYRYDFLCDGDWIRNWYASSLDEYEPHGLTNVRPLYAAPVQPESGEESRYTTENAELLNLAAKLRTLTINKQDNLFIYKAAEVLEGFATQDDEADLLMIAYMEGAASTHKAYVPLTDADIDALWETWLTKKYGAVAKDEGRVFARAVEKAVQGKL